MVCYNNNMSIVCIICAWHVWSNNDKSDDNDVNFNIEIGLCTIAHIISSNGYFGRDEHVKILPYCSYITILKNFNMLISFKITIRRD